MSLFSRMTQTSNEVKTFSTYTQMSKVSSTNFISIFFFSCCSHTNFQLFCDTSCQQIPHVFFLLQFNATPRNCLLYLFGFCICIDALAIALYVYVWMLFSCYLSRSLAKINFFPSCSAFVRLMLCVVSSSVEVMRETHDVN